MKKEILTGWQLLKQSTKQERIETLKEYKEALEKEAKGVEERIRELEKVE